MANTGFIINTTVRQFFTSGPNSGSAVATGSDVDLTVSPFSASLDNKVFFNRAFDPINCPEGFETCLPPLLTSLNTGSLRGRFEINYVTQSSFNTAIDITASVSNDINFSTPEIFSASIANLVPVTTSFTSGTIYFKAFTSCSGPDPSANSDLLSFTYDLLPPPNAGTSEIVFKNNYSSPMLVEIRSLRGNANYNIEPGSSVTYDYTFTPDPGSWTSTGKSEDLNITIKGGVNNPLGNLVQRVTVGENQTAYTTGGGFDTPNNNSDETNNFAADRGISFTVKQLSLPTIGSNTTTTFTLLQKRQILAVAPPPGPEPEPAEQITSVFGSIPFSTQNNACSNVNVNFREKHYYHLDNILYDSLSDAQANIRTTFPFTSNYIITSRGRWILVNQTGRIISYGTCVYPTIQLYTLRGSYATQQEACARSKSQPGSQTFTENNITLPDGRYPIFDGSLGTFYRGGTNAIVSNRQIIAIENCGSELTPVLYSSQGFLPLSYPLDTPSLVNPFLLQRACNFNDFVTYYIGQDGLIYYENYVLLGSSIPQWFKSPDGTFVLIDNGVITDTASPC
jgi:hypothetical protein